MLMVIFPSLSSKIYSKNRSLELLKKSIQSIAAYAIIGMTMALLLNLSDFYSKQSQIMPQIIRLIKVDRVGGVEPTTSAHQQLSNQGPCMHLLLSHSEHFFRADVEIVPLLSIDHHTKCCTELGCSRRLIHHPLPSINDRLVLRRRSADHT
jgi:hypothetical protein